MKKTNKTAKLLSFLIVSISEGKLNSIGTQSLCKLLDTNELGLRNCVRKLSEWCVDNKLPNITKVIGKQPTVEEYTTLDFMHYINGKLNKIGGYYPSEIVNAPVVVVGDKKRYYRVSFVLKGVDGARIIDIPLDTLTDSQLAIETFRI